MNTAISYYTKGAVAAFLLDARVRTATGGARTLDDVMRLALARNPVSRGYTQAEFRAAASEVAGVDLSSWFARVFDSTEELDYREALEWFGLRFADAPSSPRAWLGAQTEVEDGKLVVKRIPRGTPAYEAGLDTGDEIVAVSAIFVCARRIGSASLPIISRASVWQLRYRGAENW